MADPNTPQQQFQQPQMHHQGAVASPSRAVGPTAHQWTQMTNAIAQLNERLQKTTTELTELKSRAALPRTKAKLNKPGSFNGKASQVEAWCAHMDSYVGSEDPREARDIALTYLEGEAFSWWTSIGVKSNIDTWQRLRDHLKHRFSPFNKQETARDKLHKWRQNRDVSQFNADFQRIVCDIPDITEAEAMDRYKRGLKSYIWDALCLKRYETLEAMMTDALTVESVRRNRDRAPDFRVPRKNVPAPSPGPTPMDLSALQIQKLTPEERDRCTKEGRCFRCRQKGHLAIHCPNAQRRVTFRRQ